MLNDLRRSLWAAIAASLLGGVAACGAPDRPGQLPEPLPEAAASLLDPVREWRVGLGPGALYRSLRTPVGPWAIHLLELDLGRCDLGFTVFSAAGGDPGRARVSDLVRESRRRNGVRGILAAVNGDFFSDTGRPAGLEATKGVVSSRGRRPVFAWSPLDGPWIGAPSAEGDSLLRVGWAFSLLVPDGATEAVAGFPWLLHEGGRVGDLEVTERPDFAGDRHPRTAVAFGHGGRRAWIVVVDGRQEGYSAGMTLPELTDFLEALGARDALNLDGGGSSVMTLGDRAVSRPSDRGGERAVANALLVRRDEALCRVPSQRPGQATEAPAYQVLPGPGSK